MTPKLEALRDALPWRTAAEALATLRHYATYEPETGHFIRNRTTSSNAMAGEIVGSIGAKGYRYIQLGKRSFKANRLAWLWMTGEWPPGMVDHENGTRSDDRWANLRAANNAQNGANAKRRKDNTSGFKGVKPFRGRWQARIGRGGAQHLGTFDTPEEAHAAYEAAARARYGEFARTR